MGGDQALVEERSVETQSLRSFEDKREDNISEAEARTFLCLQCLDQLSPPIPARCFQEQDGGCLIHLDKSSKVERRTDKSKVTKAEVHPKGPVAGERAGNYMFRDQKAYLTEGSSQALKGKDDI